MIDFTNKKLVPFLALTAAFAWGFAYPLIKLGMEEFQIASTDVGSKTLFAGIRFMLAGIVVLLAAKAEKRSFHIGISNLPIVVLFALMNTALHYFFFYVGLSNSYGARASILNTLGTFILVFLSCAVFKDEHLTIKKVVGCITGFAGLLILNLGGGESGHFTFLGDGFIILNAVCSAVGGILTRIVSKRIDALVATGLSLSLGGVMLIASGKIMGGGNLTITPLGIFYLACLVTISVVGFSLYNQLIKNHPVGNVAIYNSMIPVFGVLTSCIFLKETFYIKYLFAAVLVAAGVVILNKRFKE